MRILGAIMSATVLIISGFIKSNEVTKRLKAMKLTLLFIEEVKEKIRFTHEKREALLNTLINEPKYKLLIENRSQIYEEFIENLGKSDVIGQINYCDMFIKKVQIEIESLSDECKSKEKLYKVLGISAGLTAAIIII